MTGQILVFGSINTDLVTYVDTLPAPGETVTGGRFESFPGGKGANQAVAAARAGATVNMFGCVGDDGHGQDRLAGLKRAGVDTTDVAVKRGVHSGIAQIIVDGHGENLIAVAPGANFLFSADDVSLPEFPDDEAVMALFQNEVPQTTTESLIRECKRRGMTVLWNLAPPSRQKPSGETLHAVDCLICNQSELRTLAGEGENEALASVLLGWGAGSVLVTLGAEGALFVTDRAISYHPAFSVDVVDTVGTGDCFCGVFACCLSSGTGVRTALRRASAAAALAATVRGAQTSMPTAAEVDRFLSARDDAQFNEGRTQS